MKAVFKEAVFCNGALRAPGQVWWCFLNDNPFWWYVLQPRLRAYFINPKSPNTAFT